MDCTENRKLDQNDIADKLPEEAWAMMKKASDEKDLDEFRDVSFQRECRRLSFTNTFKTGVQDLLQGCSHGYLPGHREEDEGG
jgi:hypothetical protein